jgi:hypothetical protein
MTDDRQSDPADLAGRVASRPPGLLREFAGFLMHNKKWWLLPVVAVLLLAGVLIVLAGTAAGPWLYAVW